MIESLHTAPTPASVPDWRPGASISRLRERASVLACIRAFFDARGVLEVDTPALASAAATDPGLESFRAVDDAGDPVGFLQTSPEFAMKRLLCAGAGPIYQLAHAFRAGEAGPLHEREFTMLEWYRPGFSLDALIDEVNALLDAVLEPAPCRRVSVRETFAAHLGLDPFQCTDEALERACRDRGLVDRTSTLDRTARLDFLLGSAVQPTLGPGRMVLVGFPAELASLARIDGTDDEAVAERFELYLDGVELANGYCELGDPTEQRRRHAADNELRRARGAPVRAVDERLLAALAAGLPDCAGVALGVDRLLARRHGVAALAEVVAFTANNA